MLAMACVVPVLVMCAIGLVVGTLLRWRVTRLMLLAIGVAAMCGAMWCAGSLTFLRIFAGPAESAVHIPEDLPTLMKAFFFSGLIGLVPALLTGLIVMRRPARA